MAIKKTDWAAVLRIVPHIDICMKGADPLAQSGCLNQGPIILEFEVRSTQVRHVVPTHTGAHDNVMRFPHQSQFGSFILFRHLIHLLSF